ncbi:hypothetical protein F1C10_10625 [Sphingomonas sp. NBWT7]|uniref:hypothetical protein n=1 Tax=Sphingomonas sp. NBWT7 TaxID=2596913 RepID=UPI0016245D3D|nr:hypothetical protein [Sphingomonas sp. NBWT7]QNE32354.1 hypothetical protein F1C10_10625 [Sphingomonas sp. NBWT7]
MTTASRSHRLHRRAGIDRVAALPPQFERVGDTWFFRRRGHGPAIRVSDDEYAGFMRTGLRAVMLHVVALPIFATLGWLLLARVLPDIGGTGRAALFGVVLSLIALALFGSLRHYADAPARLLAHRPPERPARDPDASMQPSYGTIVGVTLVLLFLAAVGTRQPPGFYVTFASVSVMFGLILFVRRLRFDGSLTAPQRERLQQQARAARAARAAERARATKGASLWQGLLLLVFVGLELAFLALGVVIGVGVAQAIFGQSGEGLSFGIFMFGFFPGLALGLLLFWPLEKLCKRWTGSSAIHAFDWIPPGW